MTNRERYDLNRNSYDKMVDMLDTGMCPIRIVTGAEMSYLPRFLVCKAMDEDCPECIQRWLNQEVEK